MLFPWLVDFVNKGHPNPATSFVTRLLAPAFSASASGISPGRGQRSPAASHSPVSQTCLAVSTLSHLQAGRTASPSASCEKPPVPSVPGLLSAVICAPRAELVPCAVSRRYKASAPGSPRSPELQMALGPQLFCTLHHLKCYDCII